MACHKFFQNKDCEYFPCHKNADRENFNCLFCYCPLYVLGDQCGGNFTYLENGIKDCSGCLRPHLRDSYDEVMKKMPQVLEKAKRKIP